MKHVYTLLQFKLILIDHAVPHSRKFACLTNICFFVQLHLVL